MTYLQLAAHLFLLLFWTRFWVRPAQEFYFNPFLSGTTRFIDSVIGFLRPALMLPERLTALVLLALFWTFQALFFARFGSGWQLMIGQILFAPPEGAALTWGTQAAFSGLATAWFLLQAWTLYFFVRLISPTSTSRATRAQEAFTFFMSPFSRLTLPLQAAVLLALHFAFVYALGRTGLVAYTVFGEEEVTAMTGLFADAHTPASLLRTGWLALDAFACGLETLVYTLLFFIFGGFAALLLGKKLPARICQESIDVLMGDFSRKTMPGGGLDFRPMIFFIVANLISTHVHLMLHKLIVMPLSP